MSTDTKITQLNGAYLWLWGTAILAVIILIGILGSKVFYGFIVPEAQTVSNIGGIAVLAFAFIAGLAAFFAPCPFAVFPSYIAYFLNMQSGSADRPGTAIAVSHALKIGSIVSLGIFSFYLAVGVVLALFGTTLASYTNWLKLAIIPLFFILGIMLVAGKSFSTKYLDEAAEIVSRRARGGKHFLNMYLYGIVYGIAAAACHLPILLVLALVPILAGSFLLGFTTFIVYALGASLILVGFTVLAAKKRNLLVKNLGLYGERVKKVAGGVFLLTGIYLVSFYVLFGM